MQTHLTRSLIFFLTSLFLIGCGGGGGGGGGSSTGGVQNAATTGNATFNFVLLRSVPAAVTNIEFTGLTANNAVVYGPVTRAKATPITLQNIPLTVTNFRLRFIEGGIPTGEGLVPVSLSAGQTTVITDPSFNNVTSTGNVTVTPSNSSVVINGTLQLAAVESFSNTNTVDVTGPATWTSSLPGIAQVDQNGLVTGVSSGQVVITASRGNIATGTTTVRVVANNAVTGISATPASLTLNPTNTQQLSTLATLGDGSSLDVTADPGTSYLPVDSNVASVSATGLVTAQAAGTTQIQILHQNQPATVNVTVTNPAATLNSLSLSPNSGNIQVGASQSIAVTGNFNDGSTPDLTASAVLTSSNLNVATTSGNTVNGVSPGPVVITANVNGVFQTANFTVVAAPGSEGLNRLNFHRNIGGLPPVTESASLSAGALLHSTYMVKNDFIGHSEDPNNQFFTQAGNTSAMNSNLSITSNVNATISQALDGLMNAPFHGVGFIDPKLAVSGFGHYCENIGTFKCGSTVNVLQGRGALPQGTSFPILWPANGQTLPYASFRGGEFPDPLTGLPGFTLPTGGPIYVQFGSGNATINVTSVTLRDNTTNALVAVGSFDETNYTNPDPSTQSLGRAVLGTRDALVIMPSNPLTPGRNYTATVINNGATITWSFNVSATANRAVFDEQTTLMR